MQPAYIGIQLGQGLGQHHVRGKACTWQPIKVVRLALKTFIRAHVLETLGLPALEIYPLYKHAAMPKQVLPKATELDPSRVRLYKMPLCTLSVQCSWMVCSLDLSFHNLIRFKRGGSLLYRRTGVNQTPCCAAPLQIINKEAQSFRGNSVSEVAFSPGLPNRISIT